MRADRGVGARGAHGLRQRLGAGRPRQRQVGAVPVLDDRHQATHHAGQVVVAPNTACVHGKKPIASRFAASAATECGLCATSSTSVGRPGTIWKRPGSSTVARPWRIACAGTGTRSRSASSAASTPAAWTSWLAPRSAG